MPKKPTPSRRTAPQKPEASLYKTPDIQAFIKKERRKDELERLNEVVAQKRVWRCTMLINGSVICILLVMALVDYLVKESIW